MISNALKSGFILGIVTVALLLLCYIASPTLLAEWWLGLLFLGIFLVVIIVLGVKYRKEETEDGYLSYGKAFQYSFVVFAISGVFGVITRILLFEVIDPDLVSVLTDKLVEQQIALLERFGASTSMIDDQMDEIKASIEGTMSVGGIIKDHCP